MNIQWYWNMWYIYDDGSGWKLYGVNIGRVFIGVSIAIYSTD